MMSKRLLTLIAFALLPAAHCLAGPPLLENNKETLNSDPIFHRGALDLQVADGVEFSRQKTGLERPNIDYELTAVRLGYMVDSPHRGGTFLRGNDEFMLEAVSGVILQGPGTAFGGLSILYRRNFLAPGAKAVPYITVGGGAVYCDAYHDRVQQALGSNFEFDLQADVGLRYRIGAHWSVDAEVAYRHLSNAHLVERNLGTNGIGGLLGVSYGF